MKSSRLLLAVFLCLGGWSQGSLRAQEIAFMFDIDKNILHLPTPMIIYLKRDAPKNLEKQIILRGRDLAKAKGKVGKPGTKWEHYRYTPRSFQYYRDGPDPDENRFLDQLLEGLKGSAKNWKAESWEAFVKAMSTRRTARLTLINTARGHDPRKIFAAFKELQRRGYIKHIPLLRNIWPVSFVGFSDLFKSQFGYTPPEGSVSRPAAAKAAVMVEILDRLSKVKFQENPKKVVDQSGDGYAVLHLWGFSDDNWRNFSKAKKVLQENLNSGKWKKLKITLFYTGLDDSKHKPQAIVLRPNARPRSMKEEEKEEWKKIIDDREDLGRTMADRMSLEALLRKCENPN